MMTAQSLKIAADISNASKVIDFVENALTDNHISIKLLQRILICTDEIYANIAQYAHAGSTEIRCMVSETQVCVEFSDDGVPYNPLDAREPDVTLSADERKIGGYGIHIVKKLMDEVRYNFTDNKNHLSIIIYIHE